MSLKKLFLFSIFIYSSCMSGQNLRITKILDTNLFELDNNQKVKFYGLFIPSLKDTSQFLKQIAQNVFKWETDFMLDRNFKIELLDKDENDVYEAIIYRSYALSDENMANRILSLGYAILLTNINIEYHSQLKSYQELSQKLRRGIWKQSLDSVKSIDEPIFINENELSFAEKKYKQLYLPLLAVSIASFALAWDSFSDASDIQKTIDVLKSLGSRVDVSELETSKTRKTIVGVTCFLAGLVTTLFSFKDVELNTNFSSIALNYRF